MLKKVVKVINRYAVIPRLFSRIHDISRWSKCRKSELTTLYMHVYWKMVFEHFFSIIIDINWGQVVNGVI